MTAMLSMKQAVLIRAGEAGALKRFYYPGARFDVVMVGGRTRRADTTVLTEMATAQWLVAPPENSLYAYARWLVTDAGRAEYRQFKEARRWR